MKKAPKSYWQTMSLSSKRDRDACCSWFAPLADGMTPHKAEVLCDIDTDAEKKVRAFMRDREGNEYKFVRTKGRNYSVSMERIKTAA